MTEFGYTMLCEQSPPDALVADIRRAEEAGFDFAVLSDDYQPWLESRDTRPTPGRCSAPPPRSPSGSA